MCSTAALEHLPAEQKAAYSHRIVPTAPPSHLPSMTGPAVEYMTRSM